MITQYHLNGKRMSGRAVRVKPVDPAQAEHNLANAAKLVGKEATMLELKKVEWRNGVKSFVVEYSDPCKDPMTLTDKQWHKVSVGTFDDLGKFFTAKDMAFLEHLYREEHEINQDEVDAIAGKALPVSEG